MNKLIGLEREFFIIPMDLGKQRFGHRIIEDFNTEGKDIANIIVTAKECGLEYASCDECGYLAEARGKPAESMVEAFYNLKTAEYRLFSQLGDGYVLTPIDYLRIPAKKLKIMQMEYGKKATKDENMYSDIKIDSYSRAGLHIHFSDIVEHECKKMTIKVNRLMNMPRIIKHFDREFAEEIKNSKRRPGAYEMKPHGFEYRSLPTSVGNNIDKLVKVYQSLNY